MPIEDFIINVYCCSYAEMVKSPLRSWGFQTKLTDSDNDGCVGEFMGKDADKSLWQYFYSHWYAT